MQVSRYNDESKNFIIKRDENIAIVLLIKANCNMNFQVKWMKIKKIYLYKTHNKILTKNWIKKIKIRFYRKMKIAIYNKFQRNELIN